MGYGGTEKTTLKKFDRISYLKGRENVYQLWQVVGIKISWYVRETKQLKMRQDGARLCNHETKI